jgi:manganese/iron transport system ATP-binding protein
MVGLDVKNITVTYKNGHTAIHNTSFSLPRGSITALVGVNGSGKSTLFKSIMGFVSLAAGSVEILGLTVQKALKSNQVAYVPQSEEIDWNFPVLVEDVVMMGRYGHMNIFRRAKQKDHQMVEMALSRVGMESFRGRQIGELSGGQKKRVFLARALAQESQIVLLDEPFTGVDVKTEEQIMALLREMRSEGKVILVSTHNLGSVPEFCDRAVLINRTVLASGTTKSVFTQENLQLAFGGVLRRFVLTGKQLHDDNDTRQVTVLSDDERPVVLYGEDVPDSTEKPE